MTYNVNALFKDAIKFGDKLSALKCESLIRGLSNCYLSFQCAHGRPTIFPLINLTKPKVNKTIFKFENIFSYFLINFRRESGN